MRALVIYESLYGNTKQLAEAIGSALERSCTVSVVHAAKVTPELADTADLLVVGAPTHVHGMPRVSSRKNAVKQGVSEALATAPGVREMLTALRPRHGTPAAAFDTRLGGPLWFTGAASRPIAAALRGRGYRVVVPPESFLVEKGEGPLRVGEIERAHDWAMGVAVAAGVRGAQPVAVS